MFLDWSVLTISFYNTISLFWLGLMVLLNGSRRAPGAWLTGTGLLLAGLFFTSHTAILGRGLADTGFGMDFWWWISWIPAVLTPLVWYGALLWYTGFKLGKRHPHQPWLAGVALLGLAVVLLLVFANPLPTYKFVAAREYEPSTPALIGAPLLVLAYLGYSLACYLLPIWLLLRMDLGSDPLVAAPRRLARPWLMGASVALLLAGLVLTWTALWALGARDASLADPAVARTVKLFDLAVAGLVAVAITLLGRSIVGFEVFTGRPLPRLGFFRHWRSTVLLAGLYGGAAAFTLVIELRPLYSLMIATTLMTVFYALYSWRSFSERDSFMARLRPFVASQDLYGELIAHGPQPAEDGSETEQRALSRSLFETLCRDVLAVRSACLAPRGALATFAGPPLVYGEGRPVESGQVETLSGRFSSARTLYLSLSNGRPGPGDGYVWAVPLWNERGLGGILFLGEKLDRSPFSEEEMQVAQAGGERLLDMLAGVEMARLTMDLLRQRVSQVRVLEGQGRRALHDEVLPDLHTAILYLSARPDEDQVRQAVEALSSAHRRISALVRDIPPGTPHRLVQAGLVGGLESLLSEDHGRDFQVVSWEFRPNREQVEAATGRLPPFAAEVAYFAARELVRNAGRHARGGETTRPLRMRVVMEAGETLRIFVEDDGVGLAERHTSGGAGSGLRFHAAMLAAVGGSLETTHLPEGGTRGIVSTPFHHASSSEH